MARLRPLGLLLAALVFATGAAAIVRAGLAAGTLLGTSFTRGAAQALVPLGIALAVTAALFALFRAGGRRALTHLSRRDLDSLSALESVTAILVVVLLVAVTFGSFTGTLLSLGLVGFGLTLALQRPILAVGGWCAILFTRLFRVGDRIEVDKLHGDVLEIALFSTRLWEVDGATGRATGRVLSVSNAIFLEKPVANATGDAPIVFDELAFAVAYGSDLAAAQRLLHDVAQRVIPPAEHAQMAERYARATEAAAIDTAFPRAPVVLVALGPDRVTLTLRYLVDARHRSRVRSELARAWLEGTGGEAAPRVTSG
ncbi:MAG: hypothetical protein QOE90_1449 [Thermoplasmata archaeon]|jgi:small-conductance mechanosensitive channel|nr:hypothetical protein [Thermoplasmata archaeon]